MPQAIEFTLLDSDFGPDDCFNVGLCCLSCPHYDQCDHHYEPEEEECA